MGSKVFKIGDRVKVYGCIYDENGELAPRLKSWIGSKATVIAIPQSLAAPGGVVVRFDNEGCFRHDQTPTVSVVQCRRLKPKVKKEPRRVWIPEQRLLELPICRVVSADISIKPEIPSDIEFIEVTHAQKNKETL